MTPRSHKGRLPKRLFVNSRPPLALSSSRRVHITVSYCSPCWLSIWVRDGNRSASCTLKGRRPTPFVFGHPHHHAHRLHIAALPFGIPRKSPAPYPWSPYFQSSLPIIFLSTSRITASISTLLLSRYPSPYDYSLKLTGGRRKFANSKLPTQLGWTDCLWSTMGGSSGQCFFMQFIT